GASHSVEELVACAFEVVGLDWRAHVRTDPSLVRGRAELHDLVGDASKARARLSWEPALSFRDLVRLLVESDLAALQAASA
ncbi:MAG: GDP-mannose 4,6-dehydratase, partial [Gaiella sp.]